MAHFYWGNIPTRCDICNEGIDTEFITGPWGFMCRSCYDKDDNKIPNVGHRYFAINGRWAYGGIMESLEE